MKALKILLALLVLGGAPSAYAEEDSIFLGLGRSGSGPVDSPDTVVNRYAKVTAAISSGVTTITVSASVVPSGTTFAPNDLILILQTRGTDLGGGDLELDRTVSPIEEGKVGRWEFARISGTTLSENKKLLTLTLTAKTVYAYDAEHTQVIFVPEYTSLYIKPSGSITAPAWNRAAGDTHGTGGVIAFLVRNTLVNEGGISADGKGFDAATANGTRTCTDTLFDDVAGRGVGLDAADHGATAGKGGACNYAGGGGGGHAGKGGRGGKSGKGTNPGGEGGVKTSHADYPGRLILGGGGGAGHLGSLGGRGGGAILIRAGSVLGNRGITANGAIGGTTASASGGGGGGGAGGTMILRFTDTLVCPAPLTAKGGDGGSSSMNHATYGPGAGGGGGGGGLIVFQSPTGCGPAVITDVEDVSGGLAGNSGNGDREEEDGLPGSFSADTTALVQPDPVVKSVTPMSAGLVTSRRPAVTVEAPADSRVYLQFDMGDRTAALAPTTPGGSSYSGEPPAGVELNQGSNTVKVVVEHKGIWSKPKSFGFTVDTQPPTDVTVVSGPDDPTRLHTMRFTFSATGGVAFECDFNNEEKWWPCSADVVYDAALIPVLGGTLTLTQGEHQLRVRARDDAGNWSNPSDPYPWEFDWTAPDKPTVTAPGSGAYVDSGTPTILISAPSDAKAVSVYLDDATTGVAATVDGPGWRFTPTPTLEDRGYRVRAVAKDEAGNESPFSDTVFFTVDTQDPAVEITYPASSPIGDKQLVVRGKAEPGSTVTVTLSRKTADGSSETVSTGSVVTGAAEGVSPLGSWRYEVPEASLTEMDLLGRTYVVSATAQDVALNTSPSPATFEFILDRGPPDTTVACPAAFTKAPELVFPFNSNESGATYQCVLDEGFTTIPVPSCSTPLTLIKDSKPYADGTYTLLVRARDAAGNVDPSPYACTWTWDVTPPGKVVIVGRPEPVTNSPLAVFRFDKNDDLGKEVTTFKCSLDGAPFETCSNPYAPVVREGARTLSVLAEDQAGNRGLPVDVSWSVITKLPVAEIIPIEGTDDPTNAKSATFGFKLEVAIESPVDYYYLLNDPSTSDIRAFTKVPAGASLTIPLGVPENEEETYIIKVLAHDTEHNLYTPRELRAVYSWKVDRKAPLIELLGKPATWERFETASFEFLAPGEERVSGFRCAFTDCLSTPSSSSSRDCSGGVTGSPRISYRVSDGLLEGRNCISVWAKDRAGNLSLTPATHEWNVDTQKPAAPVIDTNEGELTANTRFPTVKGEAEPFAEVSLFVVDGASMLAATVGADSRGRWEAKINQELSDGSHGLQASAKDRAGNEGPLSEPVTLLVDAQSPAQLIGGGVGCTASGNGGALLALLGLAQVLVRSRGRRRE